VPPAAAEIPEVMTGPQGQPHGAPPSRGGAPPALPPTQTQIAELVARGASNKEIAGALFLSIKTVEWNLTRIFRALGLRSRTELRDWVEASGRR
jgi:DNA-binding NarL/FixJ family response regulator